jgi:DNA-binding NarL/FixJ family response regulator
MQTIRVVLADDHAGVRGSIRRILESAADIEVVGEAVNGSEALRLVEELAPDVLLLDMEMPGLKGLDVARQLRAAASAVYILALSAYDDRQYIQGMLANGAAGYLTKDEAPLVLVQAMRSVSRGERGWISGRAASKLAQD